MSRQGREQGGESEGERARGREMAAVGTSVGIYVTTQATPASEYDSQQQSAMDMAMGTPRRAGDGTLFGGGMSLSSMAATDASPGIYIDMLQSPH